MAYVAITSDLHGYIFSIDEQGDLYRNHRATPGAGPLIHPGLGRRVGTGWGDAEHVGATRINNLILVAGVTPGGVVLTAQTMVHAIDAWDEANPIVESVRWSDLVMVCAGPRGSLYGLTSNGALQQRMYSIVDSPAGMPMLSPTSVDTIGDWKAGEATRVSFFSSGKRFFDITRDGELRYHTASSKPGPGDDEGWTVLSTGWTGYQRVLAADEHSLYAIASEGALVMHRFAEEGDGPRLLPSARPEKIGTGFGGWATLPCAVEGYATPQSGRPGDTITFHTGSRCNGKRVAEPCEYHVDYVRLRHVTNGKAGVYDKIGSQLVPYPAEPRLLPEEWIMTGAQWPEAFRFEIPAGTQSGIYAAQLTDTHGLTFYAPFIVRPAIKSAPFAVLSNTNTWNAYNSWGGRGKYVHAHPLPHYIPFDRPHPGLTPDIPARYPNPELFNQSNHLLRAELWVLGWLDSLGADYAYDLYTDRDLHDGIPGIMDPESCEPYKALILTVHPEYWTAEMYDFTKQYQDRGGSVIYLGGNGLYEQVVFEPSGVGLEIFPGVNWLNIPWNASNQDVRKQCLWRVRGRPERAIIGVGFEESTGPTIPGQSYRLATPALGNPALLGLFLSVGDRLGKESANPGFSADGWEVDTRGTDSPAAAYGNTALLGLGKCGCESGEMLYYETGFGGVVFAGSSLNFGGSLAVDVNLQRIVRNVLDITRQLPAPVA